MANSFGSFYQTVLAAATEATQLLAPTWKASESIYVDFKPVPATIGQTLNIAIPQDPTNAVADQGGGDPILTDVGFNTIPIVYNQHPSYAFVVRDWEQFNSPIEIRNLFMDAALKAIKNYINAKITGLFTSANFGTNSAISTTAHLITTAQFLGGMAVLADQRVPVANDPANMSLIVPSTPYTAILGDSNWTQAQIAGMKTAEFVRETGVMPTAYGMTVKLDQQMPTSGHWLVNFTAAYFHKWAAAMVTRPLPKPDPKVTDSMYVDFSGVPIRITIGYNQWPKQGYIVTIDAGFGLKVVRPEMCQLYSIAE